MYALAVSGARISSVCSNCRGLTHNNIIRVEPWHGGSNDRLLACNLNGYSQEGEHYVPCAACGNADYLGYFSFAIQPFLHSRVSIVSVSIVPRSETTGRAASRVTVHCSYCHPRASEFRDSTHPLPSRITTWLKKISLPLFTVSLPFPFVSLHYAIQVVLYLRGPWSD